MNPESLVRMILVAYPKVRVLRWLHRPNPRLDNQTPMALLERGEGDRVVAEARAIESGTVALDHADVLNGRLS